MDHYPLAFSKGLIGLTPEKRDYAPHSDVVIVSMKSGPSSWFVLTEINGKMFNFLIDSGASVISRNFYDNLPETKPSIQNTNIKFCVANGSVNKAAGVCHLPVTLTFGTLVKSICLLVFVCDFLSPNMNCVFWYRCSESFQISSML